MNKQKPHQVYVEKLPAKYCEQAMTIMYFLYFFKEVYW